MKVAVVTGANRGLGKGFVEYLVLQNYKVFACMRNVETQDELFSHKNVTSVALDISSDTSIQHAYELIMEQTEVVDLLINNAGVNGKSGTDNHQDLVNNINTLSRDSLLYMFNINSISPTLLMKRFLPAMKHDPSFIINISSFRASFSDSLPSSSPNYGYRSSKLALNMMTFCASKEIQGNIQIFAVDPGSVQTDMNPDGNFQPIEQAEKILAITKNWNKANHGKFLQTSGELFRYKVDINPKSK